MSTQPADVSPRRTSRRGLLRRQQLLEAAGVLLMEQGFAAVSHRAVAQQAQLPLAATTYYFASLDELVEAAVRELAEGWLARADAVVADLPAQLDGLALAQAVVSVAALAPAGQSATESHSLLSLYDRYVEAARHEHLRPVVAEYNHRIQVLMAEVLRRGPQAGTVEGALPLAGLVLAVVDGALLRALAEGLPDGTAIEAVALLLQVLGGNERRAG